MPWGRRTWDLKPVTFSSKGNVWTKENHRTAEVGRYLLRLCSPTLLLNAICSGPCQAELWDTQRMETPQSLWVNMFQCSGTLTVESGLFFFSHVWTLNQLCLPVTHTETALCIDIKSPKISLWQYSEMSLPLVHRGMHREALTVLWIYQQDCLLVRVTNAN